MNKEMLLMMLMQQAPQILKGLTQRDGFSPMINVPQGTFGGEYPDQAYVNDGGFLSNIVEPNPDGFDLSPEDSGLDPAVIALLKQYRRGR
jgi:hypothetical protein